MNSKAILFAVFLFVILGWQGLGETRSSTSAQELLNLGMIELGKGRYDRAVDALREAIRLSPDLAAAHRTLGETYAAFGRNQDAIACFLEASRLDPLDAQAQIGLGNAYQALRRPREAIGAFKQAASIQPNSTEALVNLGNILASVGPLEEAIEHYKRAVTLDPALVQAYANLGMTYRRLGRDDEAAAAFSKAIRFNANDPALHSMLGDAYAELGQYAEPVESFNQLERMQDPSENLYRRRGFLNLYLARGDGAAADGRACLDVIGWQAEASQYMALLAHFGSRQAEKPEEAARMLEESANRCNQSKWPYPVLQYLRGELESREVLARAINNDDRTEAHGYIGLDLALKGKIKEALEHFSWVREYGNRQFVEYKFALAELKRMEDSGKLPGPEVK